jgi:hypothetical protein
MDQGLAIYYEICPGTVVTIYAIRSPSLVRSHS